MSDFPSETINIIKIPRFWRVQSAQDIKNGDISTLRLEFLWRIDWVKAEDGVTGAAINSEPGGSIVVDFDSATAIHYEAIASDAYAKLQLHLNPPPPEEPPPEPEPSPEVTG